MKKAAVVYYSWSGNTAAVAELISNKTGARLLEITPLRAYPSDYSTCVAQAKKEIRTGFMPELKPISDNPDSYVLFFIGTPIWWYTMAPPVHTFLNSHDWSGKTIVPFCTHGGGGSGHFFEDVSGMCKKTIIIDGLELYGTGGKTAASDIDDWLKFIDKQ